MTFANSVTVPDLLSPLDWCIIGLSLVITLAIGWAAGRRRAGAGTVAEYLLMGRRLTLPLFIFSLVSSWYGGIFGVTAIAFESGIFNFITQGAFWYVTYLIFAFFLLGPLAKHNVVTLPELVTKLYGPGAGRVSAVFNFFNMLPVAYSLSLGIFVQALTGMALVPAIGIGTAFVILYSAFGGMRSDVYTDVFQTVLMYTSVGALVFISVTTFGGWDFLRASLPATHFEPMGGHSLAQTFLWGFIALGTLVDPTFYQRCFAARDPRFAKKGIIASTFFWMIFDIGTTASGMYARAVIPGAEAKDSFITYGLQVLPDGLRGLLIAGILATIMSTVDTFNFIAATTINYDLAGKKDSFKKWQYVAGVIFSGILSALIATQFEGSIKGVWKTMGSYWAGCLVVPLLVGLRGNMKLRSAHFIAPALLAAVGITIWRYLPREGLWADIDDLYIGLVISSVGMGIAWAQNRRSADAAAERMRQRA